MISRNITHRQFPAVPFQFPPENLSMVRFTCALGTATVTKLMSRSFKTGKTTAVNTARGRGMRLILRSEICIVLNAIDSSTIDSDRHNRRSSCCVTWSVLAQCGPGTRWRDQNVLTDSYTVALYPFNGVFSAPEANAIRDVWRPASKPVYLIVLLQCADSSIHEPITYLHA